jgi:ribosomal-protein-alanine N-acetyltransferase
MIVHTILYVADQKKSTDFYSFVLGMTPTLDVPGMTEFKLSDKHILGLMPENGIKKLLGEKLPDPSQANGTPRVEVYFRVDDPEPFHQRAMERGVIELSSIQPRGWGDRAGYVLDLDGHVLVFATSLEKKKEQVHIPQPTLQTTRLTLTPYTVSDLEDIFSYASHPEVSKFVPWEAHKTIEDSKKFLDFIKQSTRLIPGKLFYVFAVRLKESGRVVGSIDFKNVNPCSGQIDYALGFDHWNKGIMSEASEAIRDWAFENLPEIVRLQAFCVAGNVGSSRVMEKIGMTREGVRKKAFILKGKPVDLIDYAIVRDEVSR